jgi:hypothetical protein
MDIDTDIDIAIYIATHIPELQTYRFNSHGKPTLPSRPRCCQDITAMLLEMPYAHSRQYDTDFQQHGWESPAPTWKIGEKYSMWKIVKMCENDVQDVKTCKTM